MNRDEGEQSQKGKVKGRSGTGPDRQNSRERDSEALRPSRQQNRAQSKQRRPGLSKRRTEKKAEQS